MFDVRKFRLISDQIEYDELSVILRELEQVILAGQDAAIVELGCYEGTTSLFIRRLLGAHTASNAFHVYDSFSGLPQKSTEDLSPAGTQFKKGELQASKQRLITHFKQAGLQLPIIHKAWFEQLTPEDLPDEICFAFLDGDFYSSIQASLNAITPRLVKNAVIVIDDYQSEALPGARKAADEWAHKYNLSIKSEQSLAILKWPY